MAHDALEQSLSEHDRPLEQQINDLNLIVNHLLACLAETQEQVGENDAKIGRCAAMAASASARAELALKNARDAVPEAREAALAELLKVAQAANDGPQHAEPPKRKCKRKLPPGWGGVVAGAAIALGLLKAHRVAAAAGAMALTAASVAPMTAAFLPDNDAHVTPAAVHHHHFRPHHLTQDPLPAAAPSRRRRDHDMAVRSARRRHAVPKAPAPTGATTPPSSPAPSPTTTPDPGPTVTPTPTPSPTVTSVLALAWDN